MKKGLKEKDYHKAIWTYLLQETNFNNTKDKSIKIINNGNLNPFEGPDIKNICLIYNSNLIIGDAEIDLRSSNWFSHNHHKSENFKKVVLHIIFEKDKETNLNTILISPNNLKSVKISNMLELSSLELEEYSLNRILRKAKTSRVFLKNSLNYAWSKNLQSFFKSLSNKRIRPTTLKFIKQYYINRFNTEIYSYLILIYYHQKLDQSALLLFYIKCKQIEKEIFINCFFPIALNISQDLKYSLMEIWWSLEATSKYGHLKRRFPQFSQRFVWQQQGMLEFLKEMNENQNLIKDNSLEFELK